MVSLIGILVALALLIFLAYKGLPVLVLGPVASLIILVFSGCQTTANGEVLEGLYKNMIDVYMGGFVGFAKSYFLLLLMSALFGKCMDLSGSANTIAVWMLKLTHLFPKKAEKTVAVVAMAMISAALTYGGISLFVVSFTTVSIGRTMYEKLDIPWELTMAGALGSATFTMTMLPGSPQLTNIVPTQYLGTTTMAAPVLGIIGSIIMLVLGIGYIAWACKRYEKKGTGFLPSGQAISEVLPAVDVDAMERDTNVGKLILSVIPCAFMLVLMNALHQEPAVALLYASVLCIILYIPTFAKLGFTKIKDAFVAGAQNGLIATANTCAIYGFGKVVSGVAGFTFVTTGLENLGGGLFSIILSVEIAAGICGSSSGGVGIALAALGDKFLASGINPQAIHRIAAMAAGGLDSLPHTTGLQSSLAASRLQMKGSYIHMFVESVLIPIIVVCLCAIIHAATGIV